MATFRYYVYADQDNRLLGKADTRFHANRIGDENVGEGNWYIRKRRVKA